MSWSNNPIMEWSTDNGSTWVKVTDHGRSPLSVSTRRVGAEQDMFDGTKRRYTIAIKRTFSFSWSNLPSKAHSFLANGATHGEWLETFYNTQSGPFLVRFRAGSDRNVSGSAGLLSRNASNPSLADNQREFRVLATEFSKEVTKRGVNFDMWDITMTLEEV